MTDAPSNHDATARDPRDAAAYLASMLQSMAVLAEGAELRNSGVMLAAVSRMVEQESLYLTGRRRPAASPKPR